MAEFEPEYIYAMCYSDSCIYEIELDEIDEKLHTEEILKRRGLNLEECDIMYTTRRINHIISLKL